MAKKKKAIKKVADRTKARKAPAPKAVPRKKAAPRPTPRPAPRPAPRAVSQPDPVKQTTSTTHAPESKEVLAEGCEWYDDGGNEGLKQRPIEGD